MNFRWLSIPIKLNHFLCSGPNRCLCSSSAFFCFHGLLLPVYGKEYTLVDVTFEKLKSKSTEAISFLKKNGYNESVCFFIDMSLPSGQNRFFVYDIAKDSIQNSGLVTHGRCNQLWLEGRNDRL